MEEILGALPLVARRVAVLGRAAQPDRTHRRDLPLRLPRGRDRQSGSVAYSIVVILVVLVFGMAMFNRVERTFMDTV